ncbi:MAG TPA: hypothetical protein VFD70_09060 [Anaerolineae bacterium]|nr:hypothetical protein [Anaerolineae bacterium]
MDNRRNQYDRGDSLELGDRAEAQFQLFAQQRGWSVKAASHDQNIHEHWDLVIEKNGARYRVDVKALKRTRRADANTQDEWIWIEFHGVRRSDRGWLYDGKADLIAFQRPDSFLIVKRTSLIPLAEKLVDQRARVNAPALAKYKLYSRRGRLDLIAQIESKQLDAIKWDIWS